MAPKTKKNSIKSLLQFVSVCILILVFGMVIYSTVMKMNAVDKEISAAEVELSEQEEELATLEQEIEYQGSDVYIEKIARENLGYIKENEIIFKIE